MASFDGRPSLFRDELSAENKRGIDGPPGQIRAARSVNSEIALSVRARSLILLLLSSFAHGYLRSTLGVDCVPEREKATSRKARL